MANQLNQCFSQAQVIRFSHFIFICHSLVCKKRMIHWKVLKVEIPWKGQLDSTFLSKSPKQWISNRNDHVKVATSNEIWLAKQWKYLINQEWSLFVFHKASLLNFVFAKYRPTADSDRRVTKISQNTQCLLWNKFFSTRFILSSPCTGVCWEYFYFSLLTKMNWPTCGNVHVGTCFSYLTWK